MKLRRAAPCPWWAERYPDAPVVADLAEAGVRAFDRLMTADGWVYKVTGDYHPADGWIAEPDWGPCATPPHRDGLRKVREYSWQPGARLGPRYRVTFVPLYGRFAEVVPGQAVERHVRPEDVAAATRESARTLLAETFAELGVTLTEAANVPATDIGLNGSFAAGRPVDGSDLDLDVFGISSGVKVRAALPALLATDPRFGRRWPLDPQSMLYYTKQAAYPEWSMDRFKRYFVDSGRDRINFFFRDVPVSIAYHSLSRAEPAPPVTSEDRDGVTLCTVTGIVVQDGSFRHLDCPATVLLGSVHDKATGVKIAPECAVTSWSRGFFFCLPGDTVRFPALVVPQPQAGVPRLVVPDFGPRWPITIVKFGSHTNFAPERRES
jgi:hypothetical protein